MRSISDDGERLRLRPSGVATMLCSEISFGQLRSLTTGIAFSSLYTTTESEHGSVTFDFGKRREISLKFRHHDMNGRYEVISLCIYLSEVKSPITKEVDKHWGTTSLLFQTNASFRIYQTRRAGRANPIWYRCNEITQIGKHRDATTGPITMYHKNALFEVGRCNGFRVIVPSKTELEHAILQDLIENFNLVNLPWTEPRAPVLSYHILPTRFKLFWQNYYHNQEGLTFDILWLLESAISNHSISESEIEVIVPVLRSMSDSKAAEEILLQIVYNEKTLVDPAATMMEMYKEDKWRTAVKEIMPEYCVRLHKVVVTATTMLVLPPSVEVSNRILRQYSSHIDRFLRVQFLEDPKRGKLEGLSQTISPLYDRVLRTLVEGVIAGGRHYRFLAFGNSQLREHGAFFFSNCPGSQECGNSGCLGLTARRIREDIGDVSKILIVAKQTARVGQAFSTTRVLQDSKSDHTVAYIVDKIGGREDRYCFSDGVGMITDGLLAEVAKNMKHTGVAPSAFQFRLGGAKGVLAAMPRDMRVRHRKKTDQIILLRASQSKFNSAHNKVEVVRLAKYGSAFLNRQFITTLWSLGVDTEVFLKFQRAMIKELDMGMLSEDIALRCLSRHLDEHGSSVMLSGMVKSGFMRRGDPFINQVLRLLRNWSLKLMKDKAKISIEKGCFLMGVVDETGTLRGHYDSMFDQDDSEIDNMDLPEIFVQITDPESPSVLKVITGVCVVGRAPALHPGDLRLVRAVDKPALRYLNNVLVFAATGDQDVPSMCSGGDLDGDDYTIIWDPLLFPAKGHRYERCMNYEGPPPKAVSKITLRNVFEFMIDFMKNNSLGQIANAHLAFAHDPIATRDGVETANCKAFADECMQLATLHSVAVDFAKSGTPARMPRELARDSYPEFMGRVTQPSFESDTPLSHLYRDITQGTEVYEPTFHYDKTLCDVPDMLEWIEPARALKSRYDIAVIKLMCQYGIQTEVELVTGFILSYDAAFSGKNEFSMRNDVAEKYAAIRNTVQTEIDQIASKNEDGQSLNHEVARKKKEAFVAAMYDVTFSEILAAANVMMSFPWVEYEVLGRLSRRRHQKQGNEVPVKAVEAPPQGIKSAERETAGTGCVKDGQSPEDQSLIDSASDFSSSESDGYIECK